MDLKTFRDNVFGKFEKNLYVFEPTWDSFRPITKVAWNGSEYSIVDSEFKKNILSSFYGFVSEEQKKLCRKLTEETELGNAPEIKNPIDFWRWCGESEVSWWRDRPVVFASKCVNKTPESWKRYLKYLESKPKTLRRQFKGRATRRLVPK
jgi:hypothetical protein